MTVPGTTLSDARMFPVLLGIRDCLTEQVALTSAGPALRRYVWHGPTAPIMDGCSCGGEDAQGRTANGDAWVRKVRVDVNTGRASSGIRGGVSAAGDAVCTLGWVVTAEIGTYRCIPIPAKGEPQPEDLITATSAMLADDEEALRRTVACCPALRDRDAVELNSVPIRAADCGGYALQLRFTVLNNIALCPPAAP